MATRLNSFREGDRAEYLAQYLLSGIGLATPIPRQEDIGIDFFCQLGDNEKGQLTFGFPFLIQIKKSFKPILFGKENPNKWKKEQIDWLYKLELPFFIGIVDTKALKINIYNTTTLNFLFYEHYYKKNAIASQIELRFNKNDEVLKIGRPDKTSLLNWPPLTAGDGFKHQANMGNPLITISNYDFDNIESLKKKKDILRGVIKVEQMNILFRSLKLYHFRWIHENSNSNIQSLAWMHYGTPRNRDPNVLINIFKSLGPIFISLAFSLKANEEIELLKKLKPFIMKIPDELKYPELVKSLPELFDPTN